MAYVGTPIDTNNQFQSLSGKRFDGDGSTTDFTLDIAPSSTLDIEVFVENVRQDPNSAYTLSGTTLSFTGAPPSGTNNIYVVHQAKAVGTIDLPEGALVDLNGGSDKLVLDADGDTTISADTDDQIDFKTGGTDRLKIDSTDVTVSTGNIVFGTASKGVYLGVTSATAANLLDDYEEGTWTPTFSSSGGAYSITHSGQQGKYTKIGQTVICHFLCSASGTPSGGSGDFRLTGLPFTPADTSTIPGGHGMVGIINNTNINVDAVQLMFNLGAADTYANLMFITDSSSVTSTSNAPNTIIHANGPRIDGTIVYRTAS